MMGRRRWDRFPGSLVIWVGLVVLAGCGQGEQTATPEVGDTLLPGGTSDPAIARTLQADAAVTAAWVATQPAFATPTDEPFPTLEPVEVEGVPPAERVGPCVAPEDYEVHTREGFCLAAPSTWTVLNVDGGMAAALNTTPGQAISLQPDWADSVKICNVMIYIAAEHSAIEHLNMRFRTFASRADLAALSGVQMRALGGMALPGFTWESTGGGTGGIYAAMLTPSHLLHISRSGSQCPLEDLLPVLETLRFSD